MFHFYFLFVAAERGPLKRHISKSASDLSDRGRLTEELEQGNRPQTPTPAPAKSAHSVPQLSVAQKTQSFFNTLKIKCFRSRSKERKPKKKAGEDGWAQRDSTDYAADNSSDHSSSATQSPQHRLLASHHQTDSSPLAKSAPSSDAARHRQTSLSAIASETTTLPGIPVPILPISDEETRRREAALRQHSFFQLRVHLKRGVDLVARDKGGTSDPYVKFKVGSRLLYKSKTIYRDLNPVWDESFTIPIEDAFVPVHIKVFDYDWGLQDDFMGSAYLDLTKFDLGKATDVKLELLDPGKNEYLGEIFLSATLIPRSQEDKDLVSTLHVTILFIL
ncbi:UNVERIFIED_CONTAM: hypothetical protein PYX00_000132 [Menopon gallinae]|uniref:C2 domain-containing protein n=1 Tax=Menopon gallinae TaxID=328185 RepID=A0AAW2I9Z6_9NEOP